MIGETLAHFKITDKLGEGGMGEVYRAEDTKLGREVALKVLPEAFAQDHERMGRFAREAKMLASLNHANIAAIYGLEEEDGRHALVMELVEGETLQERIAKSPVPLREAAKIGHEMALALETAHEKGIVHRDLKPANVKITPDGQVKVLDFGLAKALEEEVGSGDIANSPTLTAAATQAGIILGTAAYMSPEQAAGSVADRRADIWSYGVVMSEMITGRQQFGGETVSHTLASVLKDEPEWDHFPKQVPPRILNLLQRCLRKDAKQRLQAIGDARVLLEEYLADPDAFEAETTDAGTAYEPISTWRKVLPWALFAATAAVLLAILLGGRSGTSTPERIVRASIPPPSGTAFHLLDINPGPAVISPDGNQVVFSARNSSGDVQLYVRNLDASQAQALSGTEGAQYPFWSPDSRWIGFFAGELKKVEASGGPPQKVADALDGKSGTWSEDGVILFAPDSGSEIHRVAASGGEATPVSEFDEERGDNSHRHPYFLPDGNHFVYLARVAAGAGGNTIVLGALDDPSAHKALLQSPGAAIYASGHLLFARDRSLMAQPFDLDRLELTGEAVPLAEDLLVISSAAKAAISASNEGTLVYQTGTAESEVILEWIARGQDAREAQGEPGMFDAMLLSPDGEQAVLTMYDSESGTADLWIYEIERDLSTRFTFDDANDNWPIWSPDSREVVFASNRGGEFGLFRKTVGGSEEAEQLYATENNINPTSWSSDGKSIFFTMVSEETDADIWVLPLEGEGEARPVRQTKFGEWWGQISPDGRWLAYTSDESGTPEIYLTPYPGPGRQWQLSTDSGAYGFWSGDGREFVYTNFGGEVMVVTIEDRDQGLRIGRPEAWFTTTTPNLVGAGFGITADAQRALMISPTQGTSDIGLELMLNWPAALETK